MRKEIKVKACCAICENLWDNTKCPLYSTYDGAAQHGESSFDDWVKWKVLCDSFNVRTNLKPDTNN
jgi:hypothetical protein